MVELWCDPGWVEGQLQKPFEGKGGPLGVGETASPEVLEYFEGVLPASTLRIWWIIGFDGLADGRHWITNPLEWVPTVDLRLEGMGPPPPPQRWWCVTHTPTGSMQLWGEVSGPALAVKSVLGAFSPDGSVQWDMADPIIRKHMSCGELFIPSEDGGVEDGVASQSLVDVRLKRFRSLATDKMFTLMSAYCLSGRMEAPTLVVEPAVAHVAFLRQNTQSTMRPDMLIIFSGEIADLLVAQGMVDPAAGKSITFSQ